MGLLLCHLALSICWLAQPCPTVCLYLCWCGITDYLISTWVRVPFVSVLWFWKRKCVYVCADYSVESTCYILGDCLQAASMNWCFPCSILCFCTLSGGLSVIVFLSPFSSDSLCQRIACVSHELTGPLLNTDTESPLTVGKTAWLPSRASISLPLVMFSLLQWLWLPIPAYCLQVKSIYFLCSLISQITSYDELMHSVGPMLIVGIESWLTAGKITLAEPAPLCLWWRE